MTHSAGSRKKCSDSSSEGFDLLGLSFGAKLEHKKQLKN